MATDTMAEGPDLPDLVPARMVNELAYCPRLFFLEWVQGRFADNTDTVEGRWRHRVVDAGGGAAPAPDEGEVKVARSVMLSSERLGVVAKVDLLQGDGDVVTPVDYKRGSPPDNPERAWEPERVQVCLQILLLRDNGYRCERGVLYFAESRQRVEVDPNEALVGRTMELLAEARSVASTDIAPPPLVDSPKCPRCSLVGLCLPDETNVLSIRTTMPPRRLVPRDEDPRPLYLTEQGAWLSKKKDRLVVTKDKSEVASVRAIDVSQVCVYGNVQVSTQVIRELMAREIPICWFSYGGWFSGMAEGLPSKHVELRRRQVITAHSGSLEIARRIVEGKIRNSRTLLRRNATTKPAAALESLASTAASAAEAETISSLLGIEGAAARTYFGSFASMLRPDRSLPGPAAGFDGRSRRPPRDAVNCLLSYLYGLVVKDLTAVTFAVGLDPYLGFYHRPRFGRPALALDLAEEFRPLLAESTTLMLVNNGEVDTGSFVVRAAGVSLTSGGRKAVISAYERRLEQEITHPVFGYRISYRRVLEVQTRLLAAHLLGEVPDYVAFTTR